MAFKMRGATLLLLLVASCSAEVYSTPKPGRELLSSASFTQSSSASSNSQSGSASAGNRISLSEGVGRATSRATSESFAQAFSDVQRIVDGVVGKLPKRGNSSKKQYCRDAAISIEKSTGALASVGVEASVSTFTFVTIDGVGEACGNADAQAEASATAFAKAVIEAWAVARNIRNVASAEASLRAVIRALATASANASSRACITADGTRGAPSFAEAFQDVIAEAYTRASASILVWLEAVVDCAGEGESFVEAEADASLRGDDSRVEGTTSTIVEGEGSAVTDAGGSARVVQTRKCSTIKNVSRCCKGKNIKKNKKKCYCSFSGRRGRLSACEADKVVTDGIVFWDYTLTDGTGGGTCEC